MKHLISENRLSEKKKLRQEQGEYTMSKRFSAIIENEFNIIMNN